jgi:hypothetical protein
MPFLFDSAKTIKIALTEVPEGTGDYNSDYSFFEAFLNLLPPNTMAISPSCQKIVRQTW